MQGSHRKWPCRKPVQVRYWDGQCDCTSNRERACAAWRDSYGRFSTSVLGGACEGVSRGSGGVCLEYKM